MKGVVMTRREDRVIGAFINCVLHGEYSEDYAVLLMEDQLRYGWLSNDAKAVFYEWLDARHAVPDPEVVSEGVMDAVGE